MKHTFIWLILCIIGSPCVSPILGQDCQPITNASNLARTANTLNQTIGINAGFDIERFFGTIPNYSYNQDSILLSDVMETSPIIRFFYSQNKDYDDGVNPRQSDDLGPLSFDELVIVNDRSTHFTENYVRILPMYEAGFEVQVAIEISHGKVFPDKWWTLEELSTEAKEDSTPNMSQVVSEIAAEGEDWATAFLKVYDPKNNSGGFAAEPIVTVLELGNEPWGADLGVEGFRAYIKGMYDAFADYYDHPSDFRIKLASAAFQGHASVGSDYYRGNLLDYAGTMIGDEGNSLVDLGPLRNALTEGVGVHNYSFTDYCDIDANTLINHPERTNNGFMAYKNISEWVNINMPAGTKKVNATEYGWNSDYEPRLYFPCADGKVNEYGGCDQLERYDEIVAISLDGRKYDYNTGEMTDRISQQIVGRTAQAAYIVRSTLVMNRWGVNKAMLYGLLDDWANPLYFSNGLIDTDRAQTTDITLQEIKDIEPNPSGKKESWYAVKRLKDILGDKYFIDQYGVEEDGGIYTYAFGDSENGTPTHLVTWTAININELENGAYVNVVNDNNNINAIQDITNTLNLATLNLPAGAQLDLSQPSIYLNGKLNDDWTDTEDLMVNNDPMRIRVSPIPVVIPLIVEPSDCDNLAYTVEENEQVVITNDVMPTRISYVDNNDPAAPATINTVCDGDCALTETVALPFGSFNFSVIVENGNNSCSRTLSVQINDPEVCNNTTINNDNGVVSISNNNGASIDIQIRDLANNSIVFDNQNSTSSIETELAPGNYEAIIDGSVCQQISVTEGAGSGSSANSMQCEGATINYGEGQISVTINSGQNASIKIHDLANNWEVVANNNDQSNNLEIDLPEGPYLVKINSNSCEEIELTNDVASRPGDEVDCQDATIELTNSGISVTIIDGYETDITIYDVLNNQTVVAANDAETNSLEIDLPKGTYLVSINNLDCEEVVIESPIVTPPNSTSCQGGTISYGDGQISITMDDRENAGIKIHDLLNGWVVVADNEYATNSLVANLPAGEYLVKINGNECEEITLEETVTTPPNNSISCQGATINYGDGEISVTMDDGENAGIKIHDLLNGWAVVANNQYATSDLKISLPEGEYLVKINSNSCEAISLDANSSSGLNCSDATINAGEGRIDVLMDDRQLATIEIVNEADESMVMNIVPRIQLIVEDLAEGIYTISINGIICQQVIVNDPLNALRDDDSDLDKSITLFPNPAKDFIQVHLPKLQGLSGTIQIYDAFGQIITEYQTDALNSYEQIELTNTRNGLYFMTIKAEDKRRIGKRFVVEDGK